jgi:N utilization substance protein A
MQTLVARTEFAAAVNQLANERGVDSDVVLETIKAAILAAFKRDAREAGEDLNENLEYIVRLDSAIGTAKIFTWNKDGSGEKVDVTPPGFGRIAAQTAKQVILQKIREAEKSAIISQFESKVGMLINGMILRFDGPNIVVALGKAEAVLPPHEQVKMENYRLNQHLTFYVEGIRESARGQEIVVSRTHTELVKLLFAREVPEVASGAVELKSVAREAGGRTKIAVYSTQTGVDPVGSCVGQKGVRVQAVIDELSGEKLDIIQYEEDPVKYIKAAIAPAEAVSVKVDERKMTAVVTVPDDQLSLAIGKEGQNVRLAAKLTGYKLDIIGTSGVKPVSSAKQDFGDKNGKSRAINELEKAGLSSRTVKALEKAGLKSLTELKSKSEKELKEIKGVGAKAVQEVKNLLK